MYNQALVQSLLPLMNKQWDAFQHELGWLLSESTAYVNHPNPQARPEIQRRLNATREGLVLVYLFAMWEQFVERSVESEWLTPAKLLRLNAFRHLRHCAAHGFEGRRARQCREEFEAVMNSTDPLPNVEWTADTVEISTAGVAIDCQRFMAGLAPELISRIAEDRRS